MLTWFQRNAAVILTLVGLMGLAASPAKAVTTNYDFTFTYSGSISSIELPVTVSGGLITLGLTTGTGIFQNSPTITSANGYGTAPTFRTTGPAFFATSTTAAASWLVVKVASGTYYRFRESISSSTLDVIQSCTTNCTGSKGTWSDPQRLSGKRSRFPPRTGRGPRDIRLWFSRRSVLRIAVRKRNAENARIGLRQGQGHAKRQENEGDRVHRAKPNAGWSTRTSTSGRWQRHWTRNNSEWRCTNRWQRRQEDAGEGQRDGAGRICASWTRRTWPSALADRSAQNVESGRAVGEAEGKAGQSR